MLPITSSLDFTNGSHGSTTTTTTTTTTTIDPYQILQIRKDATTTEIKQAYKRLALLYHPARRKKKDRNYQTTTMELFVILAACYETLMDKEARIRCDMLLLSLQDQENALLLLQQNLSWKSTKSSQKKRTKWRGFRVPNKLQTESIIHYTDHHLHNNNNNNNNNCSNTMDCLGVSSIPSLAEMSTCGSSSSLGESFQEDHLETDDWRDGCVTKLQQVDGYEQVEIIYSLDTLISEDMKQKQLSTRNIYPTSTKIDCSNDHQSTVSTSDRTSLRPLRILPSQQPSTDEEDNASLESDSESTVDCAIKQTGSSHSTNNSVGKNDAPNTDIHYTGAEIDRLFGGPLQLLFRARRWQVFKDPFEVFAEVFGSPLYGDVSSSTTVVVVPPKNGPSRRITSMQLLPPIEKLPSEHINRLTTIHRTRRITSGKEIVRTAVVRIDPSTGQRHVTISVTSDDTSLPDVQEKSSNSFFQFLESLCTGKTKDTETNEFAFCFCFDFSIYT